MANIFLLEDDKILSKGISIALKKDEHTVTAVYGYLEALRENRIPIEKELVVCRKIDYEEGKIATETLLSLPQPPDAILAMNDTLAFAAMEVIKNHGLRIPNDVAIIGYTDEQHANYVEPKLSAVSHQTYKMGETACQLLIDQIKGDKTIKQVTIPTHLQIRESSIKNQKCNLL